MLQDVFPKEQVRPYTTHKQVILATCLPDIRKLNEQSANLPILLSGRKPDMAAWSDVCPDVNPATLAAGSFWTWTVNLLLPENTNMQSLVEWTINDRDSQLSITSPQASVLRSLPHFDPFYGVGSTHFDSGSFGWSSIIY